MLVNKTRSLERIENAFFNLQASNSEAESHHVGKNHRRKWGNWNWKIQAGCNWWHRTQDSGMHLDQGRNIRNIQAASLQILFRSLIKTQAAASPCFSLLPAKGASTEQLLTKGAKLEQHFGGGTPPVPQVVTEPSWSIEWPSAKLRDGAESREGFSISTAHTVLMWSGKGTAGPPVWGLSSKTSMKMSG